MAILVNTNTPNALNGVSQQADDLRRPSQATEQINALSSLIEGLKKRPPTVHQKIVTGSALPTSDTLADFHGFSINRDADEKHYVRIKTGASTAALEIDNLVSPSSTVVVKNGAGVSISSSDLTYLHTTNAQSDLRSITIDDYTFVVNRAITPEMAATTTTARDPEGLLFVKQTRENAVYTINLWKDPSATGAADYTASHTAVAADDQGDVTAALVAALTAATANAFFAYSSKGSVLHISEIDGSDFRVEAVCTLGDAFYGFKDEAQALELLPEEGYAGFKIKIVGDADTADDEYYVKYTSSNSNITTGFTNGYWEEAVAGGIEYQIDGDTMPHVLLSNADGSFTFKATDWGERTVGDTDSLPSPSFIDDSIRGAFFFKNRLGLVTGESVVFSEVGEYFNFFRTTIVQLLDSDPIDIQLASSDISLLNWGLTTSEKLVLFSDRIQFTVESSNDVLSASTIESKEVTHLTNFENTKPIQIGNSIFFGYDKGAYSGVKEYFIGDDTTLFESQDISDQIPRYIEGDILKFAAVDAERIMCVKSDDYTSGIYAYTYYDQGNRRVQAAWCKLDFGTDATVYDIFSIGTKVYTLIKRGSQYTLEYLDVASGLKDDNSDIVITLDRRITEADLVSASYSAITNLTTIEVPYDFSTNAVPVIVTRPTVSDEGNVRLNNVKLSDSDSSILTVTGDYSAADLFIGQTATMTYVMTRPTIREQSGETTLPVYTGRAQVRYCTISLDNSRFLEAQVTPLYRNAYNYTFTSRQLGTGSAIVGDTLASVDDSFRIPIMSKNTQFSIVLTNDSPFPSNILGFNWEMIYHSKSRRI
jgi:hypothetical protein